MSYTEKHLDQVDSYLSRPGRNGDGPPHLSKEGQTDPHLKEAMKDVEMVWQATRLEKLQGKLDMLREYEEEIQAKAASFAKASGAGEGEAKEERSGKVINLGRRKWILSMAAGVLILVAAGWWLFRPEPVIEIQHRHLAEHFDEYVLHDVLKGDVPTQYTPEQLRAYNLFAIRSFDEAIPLLEKQWTEGSDSLALYYLIVTRLGTGDTIEGQRLYELYHEVLTPEQIAQVQHLLSE